MHFSHRLLFVKKVAKVAKAFLSDALVIYTENQEVSRACEHNLVLYLHFPYFGVLLIPPVEKALEGGSKAIALSVRAC